MQYPQITLENIKDYKENGFVIKRSFFSNEEIGLLKETYLTDVNLQSNAIELNDSETLKTKLSLWYDWGDDTYGAFMRSERIVNGVEAFLGGRSALYHTKMMQKEPRVGGAWEWHQDYGYWYKNGFLFPDMLSVMVAVSEATKENGCLQIIAGTHRLNRIEHGFSGEQVGAEQQRVDACLEHGMELKYVELAPGDTLFFHCNLLHRSAANRSDYPRMSLISAYNLASNKSFMEEPEQSYQPVDKLPDSFIIKNGVKCRAKDAAFHKAEEDKALQ